MTRLIGLVVVGLSFSIICSVFAKNNKMEQLMEDDPVILSVAKALKIANTKARELGFDIEHFYISITEKLTKDDNRFFSISEEQYPSVWKIYYGPKGKLMFGGDLTIYIDRVTWEIIKVWEGE